MWFGLIIWQAAEQSAALNVKALEERQERILARLYQLQLKVKKIADEARVLKSIPLTSCVSICLVMTSMFMLNCMLKYTWNNKMLEDAWPASVSNISQMYFQEQWISVCP